MKIEPTNEELAPWVQIRRRLYHRIGNANIADAISNRFAWLYRTADARDFELMRDAELYRGHWLTPAECWLCWWGCMGAACQSAGYCLRLAPRSTNPSNIT
jgi:hypothetical protein